MGIVETETFKVSNSKANTWRRCPYRYKLNYVLGLRRRTSDLPRQLGTWMHHLLMTHYDGQDWRDAQDELTVQFHRMLPEEREELGDLPTQASRIMRNYVRFYANIDQQYTTVASEVNELVDLPTGGQFNLIVDLIVKDASGGLWLWDHKCVKQFMPPEFMLMDTQLTRYFWAALKLGYSPVRGVVFNQLLTKPPTVPKLLQSGKLSQDKRIVCDSMTYLETIKSHGLNPKDYLPMFRYLQQREQAGLFFQRTELPTDIAMSKRMMRELAMTVEEIHEAGSKDRYPRSIRKDCKWDCDYQRVCSMQLQGVDPTHLIQDQYTTREQREREESRSKATRLR